MCVCVESNITSKFLTLALNTLFKNFVFWHKVVQCSLHVIAVPLTTYTVHTCVLHVHVT